ncbi:MAG: hypothetical protein ACR2PO_15495 [Methyloligellaceae bacterium]
MDVLIYLFAAAVAVAALLATIAIWAPRATWIRVTAVGVTALFIPLAYAELTGLLSRPKPMDFEWFERHVEQAVVLSVSLLEGKAIYLWLRLDSSLEPRYYVMPWRKKLAEKLEDTIEAAVKSNSSVVLKKPFFKKGFGEHGELNLHIIRPPSQPKKLPRVPPRIFNPRSDEI